MNKLLGYEFLFFRQNRKQKIEISKQELEIIYRLSVVGSRQKNRVADTKYLIPFLLSVFSSSLLKAES